MFLNCPRCDSDQLDSSGSCNKCGYTLRVPCRLCDYRNIPQARFCGGCGKALTLKSWFNRQLNQHLNYFSRLKIRKFAAGIAFGTLLGTFAFGSMGMQSPHRLNNPATSPALSQNLSNIQQNELYHELSEFRNSRKIEGEVKAQDLKRFTEILLAHLTSVKEAEAATSWQSTSAAEHLQKARATGPINRGNVALLIFNIACEYLNLNYRDFGEQTVFFDIPRFHFLSAPAAALSNLGIRLNRNEKEFGSADPVTVNELFLAGISLAEANSIRLRQKVFYSLAPR